MSVRARMSPVLAATAERQFGVVSRAQVLDYLGTTACRSLVADGILVRVTPGVYRVAGASLSFRQRAMAACLAYGEPVAVSHTAAARLWGCEEVHCSQVEVTVPWPRSGRQTLVATHRASLPPGDVRWRFGIPVSAPARLLLDLSKGVTPLVLGKTVDDLLRRRLLTFEELTRRLADPETRHPGVGPVRALIATRADTVVGESVWEDRVFGWLDDAGMRPPVRQHQVSVRGALYRLDMAYPPHMVAVEFDGWSWHTGRTVFDHDRRRLTDLAIAGWLVVLVTSQHGRRETVRHVGEALRTRGWAGLG